MKRWSMVWVLLLLAMAATGAKAQSTQERCQLGACYSYGPPAGSCVGAFIYSDLSQTPVAQYACRSGAWTSVGSSGSSSYTGTPGALVDYNFTQGSGSTLTDITGNGNSGTLGTSSAAPTWTTGGLAFANQQYVSLPASINAAQTLIFGVYLNPMQASALPFGGIQYPVLLTSSLGAAGYNLMYTASIGTTFQPAVFGVTVYGGSGVGTSCGAYISGFHVIAKVLGTGSGNLDHVYIDGQECSSYNLQGASYGLQSSGNYFLGAGTAALWNQSSFYGTMYRFKAYTTQLTATQIQYTSAMIVNDVASRGVPVAPVPLPLAKPQIHAIGDSITCGWTGSGCAYVTAWPNVLSLTNQPTYTVTDWGVPGVTLQTIAGSEANRVALQCKSTAAPVIAIVMAGTNDFAGGAIVSQAAVTAVLGQEITTLKLAGCRVFVGTMISRTGLGLAGETMDSDKDGYDALILQQAKTMGADGVIDFAANPLMGADGAYASGTYFLVDQVHPTVAGQALLGAAASNTLNYYFGYTQGNPHIVTAATYTMLSGDGYVTANPTANQTLTLPDCTGPSGVTYTVANIQSTYTVGVVTGNSAQLINGLTAATAVSVPSNSSVVFRDVPNAKTVSGCHWEK